MNEDCRISDAEWQVMRVVWTLGQANSSEIIEQLAANVPGARQRSRPCCGAWKRRAFYWLTGKFTASYTGRLKMKAKRCRRA